MPRADTRTDKRRLGDIGEDIACKFLKKHGFEVLDRNYLQKWGEIDIVARKAGVMHFVEVKSVRKVGDSRDNYRPEDNMHPWKLKRLARTIQTYLLHKKLDCEWQLDLITVKIDEEARQARVELIENIVI